MEIAMIRAAAHRIAAHYPVRQIALFGSQADGTATRESDVDLIVEFSEPITLLTLARMKQEFEDILGTSVDLIHGPMRETDMIEVHQQVVLYAA
ncbi:MAG: nucleotidyltransferase domain-containing protein [Selenomonas sp.]|uniref:nucleotidyltransferase family protein n=1 Tax=uncultured Selenomonas sp. TaxID=159275 RepID=UPI0025EE6713|nr:nucleotidyltransferase domain-containing protein [uncultured Selenomonas sp.]MDD6127729.1 nucleotidyltransferase domain-containing protein [Veillonellaceae bacterium]MDY6350524.1 nucleotidyltransferase domain-containing protein [Selenomonas sp.]